MANTAHARTVTPPAPASAGATNTANPGQGSAGLPESGPLPRSALAAALVRNFEGQFPNETQQPQGAPASSAGQPDPNNPDNPGQGAVNADEVQPTNPDDPNLVSAGEATENTDLPSGEATEPPAAAETELPAGEAPAEELATELEPGDDGADLPIGVRKRIGKLLARLKQLEDQVAKPAALAPAETTAAPAASTRPPGPLDAVTDPAELEQRENVTSAGLVEVDNLLARLPVQPALVEKFLRASGIELKDENGEVDFSNESMLAWLTNTRTGFHNVLRAIPKRRAYLEAFKVEHANALKLFPWMGVKTDQRHALMSSFLAQAPGLRSAPNHEYWLGCAIRGHLETEAEMAKAGGNGSGNGHGAAPRVVPKVKVARPGPGSGTAPTAGPRARPDQVRINAARERVTKEKSKEALSEFLQATNFVK